MTRPHLYLDLDGVFADFDAAAEAAIGTDNTYKWEWINGSDAFWAKLNAVPNFFETFPLMDGALELWDAVSETDRTILTAIPKLDGGSVAGQKRRWIRKNLSPDVPVITCLASEKPFYCTPGDVLVDDRRINEAHWVRRGGIFIHHVSAASTIEQLRLHNII